MKKLILIAAAVLVLSAGGCGKKNEEITVTSAPATEAVSEMPTAESQPSATAAADVEQIPPEESPSGAAEQSGSMVSQADAEQLVKDATGADAVKSVDAAGDAAYIFDCYSGDAYMGTVEVNKQTGELIYQ